MKKERTVVVHVGDALKVHKPQHMSIIISKSAQLRDKHV